MASVVYLHRISKVCDFESRYCGFSVDIVQLKFFPLCTASAVKFSVCRKKMYHKTITNGISINIKNFINILIIIEIIITLICT